MSLYISFFIDKKRTVCYNRVMKSNTKRINKINTNQKTVKKPKYWLPGQLSLFDIIDK